MKKLLTGIFLSLVMIANFGVAAAADDFKKQGRCQVYVKDTVANLFPTQFCNAGDLITAIIKILLALISMVAVVVIVLAGYKYVTSQGNTESAGQARKAITNAVIGLVVAVLAYTLVAVVSNTLGNSGGSAGVSGDSNNQNNTQANAQTAARNNLKQATTLSARDTGTGSGRYTTFTVQVTPDPDDISVLCPAPPQSGLATAAVRIPFSTGEDRVYSTESGYGINVNSPATVDMVFTTESDPLPAIVDPDAQITVQVQINLNTGCSIRYDFNQTIGGSRGGDI